MTDDELLEYILERSGSLLRTFSQWVKSSERFRKFVEEYRDKVCDKFTEARSDPQPDEKLRDTLFELEIAYLVLKSSSYSVKYELRKDGPDFTLTAENAVQFNIEVKRIRKACEEKRLEAWRADVAREIRAVPSTLAVGLDVGLYVDELDALLGLLGRLEREKADAIACIVKTIRAEEKDIPADGIRQYTIPGFEDEVEFQLSKPSRKSRSDHTTFNGGGSPLFIRQQEWKQFKDLVFPRNDQRILGMINILAINTDSATHDVYAFIEEIETDFMERVAQGNVTEQMRKLSGVLFRGACEKLLWPNDRTAYCPIPKNIAETLARMG